MMMMHDDDAPHERPRHVLGHVVKHVDELMMMMMLMKHDDNDDVM